MQLIKTLIAVVFISAMFGNVTSDVLAAEVKANEKSTDTILNRIGVSRGICVVLGDAKCEARRTVDICTVGRGRGHRGNSSGS